MRIGNSRRHARVRYTGAVRLAWDEHGAPRYASGKCVDLSSNGLRVEAPVGIPVGSRISLRIDELKLSASALLKNASRRGSKSLMGLELSQALHEKVLGAISQSLAQANGAQE